MKSNWKRSVGVAAALGVGGLLGGCWHDDPAPADQVGVQDKLEPRWQNPVQNQPEALGATGGAGEQDTGAQVEGAPDLQDGEPLDMNPSWPSPHGQASGLIGRNLDLKAQSPAASVVASPGAQQQQARPGTTGPEGTERGPMDSGRMDQDPNSPPASPPQKGGQR
jgi:hypothetical protein